MMQLQQTERYHSFYSRQRDLRWLFRFDVRYRRRRLRQVLAEHGVYPQGLRVLDVGFGSGQLLKSFPTSCSVHGAEISRSSVEQARLDPDFAHYRQASFSLIREECPDDLHRAHSTGR